MPNRRLSDFGSVKDLQKWLLRFGLQVDPAQVQEMMQDPRSDYKVRVYNDGERWKVIFKQRPWPENLGSIINSDP